MTRADRAVARVRNGESMRSVADDMNYTTGGLNSICHRRGVLVGLPLDPTDRGALLDAFERGWSDADICESWGKPLDTVERWRAKWLARQSKRSAPRVSTIRSTRRETANASARERARAERVEEPAVPREAFTYMNAGRLARMCNLTSQALCSRYRIGKGVAGHAIERRTAQNPEYTTQRWEYRLAARDDRQAARLTMWLAMEGGEE